MVSLIRITGIVSCLLIAASCVTDNARNRAVLDVMAKWKAVNDATLRESGKRRFDISKKHGFLAAQSAAQRIGMVVEKESYETGFLLVTSNAPTPLTMEEWKVVQDKDTEGVRRIVGKHSVLMGWFYTLEPASKELLANLFVTENQGSVEVSVGFRLRSTLKTTGAMPRLEAPPSAVPMGLAKFWSAFEKELELLTGRRQSGEPVSVSERTEKAAGSPESISDSRGPAPDALPPKSPEALAGSVAGTSVDPDAVAVIIGNRNYGDRVPSVDYAHNDADAMRRFIVGRIGVSTENLIDLRDASLAEMESALGNDRTHEGKLWRWVRPEESDVYLFYSGHGVPGLRDGREYLLPVDADPDAAPIEGYPTQLLYRNLARLKARSVTVFLDTCFSGETPSGPLLKSASGIRVTPTETYTAPFTVVSAARGDQVASWDTEAQHSLFTKHLLDALGGAADSGRYGERDGKITLGELSAYLDREMTYAARRQFGREQRATVTGSLEKVIVTLPD